jgi:hypothetical protein
MFIGYSLSVVGRGGMQPPDKAAPLFASEIGVGKLDTPPVVCTEPRLCVGTIIG